ncbi:MAG TPA: glycine betaine ABC transporter substrate-binding protein [Myxococcota bacterium]|nr:glycine betaine ABC transporter substrate-binding protein [Myxococcota bacterium]
MIGLALALVVGATPVRVGSKAFTESVIIGEIARQTLEAHGVVAAHQRELGGTAIAWKALLGGEIDVYPEYSGTIVQELIPGAGDLESALAKHGVVIAADLGFDDSYGIGVRPELPLRTISELRDAPGLRVGLSNEFLDRQDGWRGLARVYDLGGLQVRGLQHALAYSALEHGTLDVIDVYTTDAEIARIGVRVLEDDKHYFPSYRALLLARSDLSADARAVLKKLTGTIDVDGMRKLNARAAIDHMSEDRVASELVESTFSVMTQQASPTVWSRFLSNLKAHLGLTAVSLLAAILVGVPLGVFAAKTRRLGGIIVGLTGVLQTVPSLALLVFMIPLFGIGYVPAVMALFVYSLLPIVQNTYVGVHDLPLPLHESAVALGLGPLVRTFRIELPLAMPSIVAGVRTSAVINVGTATLGALIGAGGFGQPILTGIRLSNVGLVLEGAVPAALLAMAAQGLLTVAERWLVPRGMRLAAEAR